MLKHNTKISPEVSTVVETVETTATNPSADMVQMVILAYEGQEETVLKAWDRLCPGICKKMIVVDEDAKLHEVVGDIIADETVSDDFILIPATVIPCAPLSREELHMPIVYVDGKGVRHYDRFPMAMSKEVMVAELASETFTPELLLQRTVFAGCRAIEASFKEGNIVTPVLRANPCEHIVMEALIRKKYIIASREGLTAITELLNSTLLA